MGRTTYKKPSWIYTRRPRKPNYFGSKRFSTNYFGNSLHTTPKKSKIYSLIIVIAVLFVSMWLSKMLKDDFMAHSMIVKKEKSRIKAANKAYALKFLTNCSKKQFLRGHFKEALYEITLALKIDSTDEELIQLYCESLLILCVEDNKYCLELDNLVENKLLIQN